MAGLAATTTTRASAGTHGGGRPEQHRRRSLRSGGGGGRERGGRRAQEEAEAGKEEAGELEQPGLARRGGAAGGLRSAQEGPAWTRGQRRRSPRSSGWRCKGGWLRGGRSSRGAEASVEAGPWGALEPERQRFQRPRRPRW